MTNDSGGGPYPSSKSFFTPCCTISREVSAMWRVALCSSESLTLPCARWLWLLSQSCAMRTPMRAGRPPTGAEAGQQTVLPWKDTHQTSTSRCVARPKPPALNICTSWMSFLFMVPSGYQPAQPPAAMCSSNARMRSTIFSLSTSNLPDSVVLKGTAIWPIAWVIVPMKGIFKRCEETNILMLEIRRRGMKVTSKIVSRKERWFATITGDRPDLPKPERNAARPSTRTLIQQLQSRANRQAKQVLTSTARRRHDLARKGLHLADSTLNLAIK
mmetsp:Transcript_2175/g.4843  ORF Transcript_2175/g.4843 Transcript_2175/m.4843 type:complete len:272 (+) Transcript_2175:144-959(+)